MEVVERLWQETGHVNAVGTGQAQAGIQFAVHEGVFHQGLAVVEGAVYLKGCDIAAQGSELLLLYLTHLAFGVEHIDADALHAQETVGYSAARIARRSHKNVDLASALSADEVPQKASHKASTHILEGKRGPVEEFERVDTAGDRHKRYIETERVTHQFVQRILRDVIAKESIGHTAGDVRQTETVDAVVEV